MDSEQSCSIGGHASNDYKDIRSSYRPIKRERKQAQKYYGYRGVRPSWLGQLVYKVPESLEAQNAFPPIFSAPLVADPGTVQVRAWTKQDQYEYRDCNIWPLDRKHRTGRRKRRNCCYVPERWQYERSSKGSTKILLWEVEHATSDIEVDTDFEDDFECATVSASAIASESVQPSACGQTGNDGDEEAGTRALALLISPEEEDGFVHVPVPFRASDICAEVEPGWELIEYN